jgi:hypothetical protein
VSLAALVGEFLKEKALELRRSRRPHVRDRSVRVRRLPGKRQPGRPSGGAIVALVLDTGPTLAILDADNPAHSRCVDLLEEFHEPLWS